MNKAEAKQALREGKKLTHKSFSAEEWVKQIGDYKYKYEYEDGVTHDITEFWIMRDKYGAWNEDWSVFNG